MSNKLSIVKQETIAVVENQIKELKNSGGLHFPENYSPENALKSAWLILQEIKDRNQKLALETCTKSSIQLALLDMAVQGLSVAKKQGYFIPYGNKLSFNRSYFGTMAVVKRVQGVKSVTAQVIYEGDIFEYVIENGIKKITKHEQSFKNIDNSKIEGAYCVIVLDDREAHTEIMNIGQIKKSWIKTKTGGNVQKEFPDQMAMRTVINRACKYFVNTSDDSDLLIESFNRSVEKSVDEEVEQEVNELANSEVIDVETAEDEQEVDEYVPDFLKEE